jgi:hypothetical protein
MLNILRRYSASCDLDRRRSTGADRSLGEFDQVHKLLSQRDAAPMLRPSPALRSRIMDGLRESRVPADRPQGWRWALAAAACLGLGIAAIPLMRPAVSHDPGPGSFSRISIPSATPMLRLVAGSVDQPLLDQAQKMYTDTRRATRAVVNCVPFARGG